MLLRIGGRLGVRRAVGRSSVWYGLIIFAKKTTVCAFKSKLEEPTSDGKANFRDAVQLYQQLKRDAEDLAAQVAAMWPRRALEAPRRQQQLAQKQVEIYAQGKMITKLVLQKLRQAHVLAKRDGLPRTKGKLMELLGADAICFMCDKYEMGFEHFIAAEIPSFLEEFFDGHDQGVSVSQPSRKEASAPRAPALSDCTNIHHSF